MAVKYLTGYKDLSDVELWSEEKRLYKFTWDFAVQGGAAADTFNVCVLPKCAITDAFMHVETEVDSAADGATLEVGIATDTDGIIDQAAEAALGADAVLYHNTAEGRLGWAEDDAVILTIAGEDVTAGKVHIWLEIKFLSD